MEKRNTVQRTISLAPRDDERLAYIMDLLGLDRSGVVTLLLRGANVAVLRQWIDEQQSVVPPHVSPIPAPSSPNAE